VAATSAETQGKAGVRMSKGDNVELIEQMAEEAK
jgi:hypothetical protein